MCIRDRDASSAVVFDAENQILGETDIQASKKDWMLQFEQAPLAYHTMEAFQKLMKNEQVDAFQKSELCNIMLQHPFHRCREMGLSFINKEHFTPEALVAFGDMVRKISLDDKKASVRRACANLLYNNGDEEGLQIMLQDSSYSVVKRALQFYGKLNPIGAYKFATEHRDDKDVLMQEIMYTTIGKYSKKFELDFFLGRIEKAAFKDVTAIASGLANYLVYNQPLQATEALDSLNKMANRGDALMRSKAISVMKTLRNVYYYEHFYTKVFIDTNKTFKKQLKGRMETALKNYNDVNTVLKTLEGK